MTVPKLEVNIRKGYGVARVYPANEPARILADIAGTKTLSPLDLQRARALGHEIHISYDEDCTSLAALILQKTTP